MRFSRAIVLLALVCSGCATIAEVPGPVGGKPLGAFFDELKADLQEVHWRLRGGAACAGGGEREVDLRNASVTLVLRRIAEASVDGELKLVALPLFGVAGKPAVAAHAARKSVQDLTLKLDVDGPAPLYALGSAPEAHSPLARALNAAIDAFMRSSASEPCIHLAGLKLQYVLDVERNASGGFRLVVPAAALTGELAQQDVNTLTVSWDKVQSNALH
ncbi:MAG: hypothetical protein ACREX6_03325 [Casimicrobiaceae bacterium]